MLRVLLVKTSSLGDVVHNFPVVTDLRRHFPDALIDWVVEEPFVPLARMHPAVRRVIPVAVRRWRTRLLGRATWKEIAEFRRLSQSERYDAIIDSQGLLKSALIARAARGRRHGFDASTAREPLAARFYDVTHHVARSLHAVVRNRLLAGAALGYRIESAVDYGLPSSDPSVGRPGPTCVLLHGTSRADKHWPVASWIDLGRRLEAAGIGSILPWGSGAERQRSEAIATAVPRAVVPSNQSLEGMAAMLAGSSMVVGLDTGLTHLAAALGRPVVAIFTGSDPALTGVHGAARACNLGHVGAVPALTEVIDALKALQVL